MTGRSFIIGFFFYYVFSRLIFKYIIKSKYTWTQMSTVRVNTPPKRLIPHCAK